MYIKNNLGDYPVNFYQSIHNHAWRLIMANNRVYYAIQDLAINGPSGVGAVTNEDYDRINGAQSVSVSTNYNTEPVYQLGQGGAYSFLKELGDVECTISRVIDGWPCIYGMAMGNNTTLTQASNFKSGIRMTVYDEASGTATSSYEMMPCYVGNVSFNFPVEETFTEEITFVGNDGRYITGTANSAGSKSTSRLMGRRNTIDMDASNFPGYGGNAVQSISISFDLGREAAYGLGAMAPYTRYINFPVEITTEIVTNAKDSIGGGAVDSSVGPCADFAGAGDTTIKVALCDGSVFDVGSNNILQSENYSGGEAGGGNATFTSTYISYSYFKYTFPTSIGTFADGIGDDSENESAPTDFGTSHIAEADVIEGGNPS